MKKRIKRIALTITILLALIGAIGTVALASGYITWGGSQDYQQTLDNLDLISERGQELKSERDTAKSERDTANTENERLENIIKDKDNIIKDKENEIDSLNQEIKALKERVEGGQTTQDQLRQAEKDMRDVKNKSAEVLGEFD